jgi:outer membrane lipase/esterase
VWADLVGGFGALQDSINRIVPIGITSQANTGQTYGTNVSLAAEGGYNFFAGPITHGPVAGMVLQQVHINGYAETDSFSAVGGFTALSFGSQVRNSAVSVLGYEAGADIGIWHPFAKLTWNHELASTDRLVTASLTSVSAPSYSMPAIVFGADWATATIGASVAISRGVTAYATFYSEIGQSNVTYYGGEVGLNVSLNTLAQSTRTY